MLLRLQQPLDLAGLSQPAQAARALAGLWVAYAADDWLRGLLNWWRWSRLGWLPAARQMHRRLHQSGHFH